MENWFTPNFRTVQLRPLRDMLRRPDGAGRSSDRTGASRRVPAQWSTRAARTRAPPFLTAAYDVESTRLWLSLDVLRAGAPDDDKVAVTELVEEKQMAFHKAGAARSLL
jgi:hypothetical protein